MNKKDYIECLFIALDEHEREVMGRTADDDQEQKAYELTRIQETRGWLESMNFEKVKVPFSEEDLQGLQSGEVFEWSFGGHDLYLYNQDSHTLLCEEENCFNTQIEDGEYCEHHTK